MREHPHTEPSAQLDFDGGETGLPPAGGVLYLEGHCTRSGEQRSFFMPVLAVGVRKPIALDDEARPVNVAHILLGTTLRQARAPMSGRIATGTGMERSVKWPKCPYCRATTVYCTGCGHVFCVTRVHEVSGWTYDEEKHTVEFCHLCPQCTSE